MENGHTVTGRRKMATLRKAQQAGVKLLALPDKLLSEIALKTIDQRPGSEPFKDWTRAASTCKRLWQLQLFSDPTIQKYGGIKWYTRRFATTLSICIDVDKWPKGYAEKRTRANSMGGVSGNLRQLERLEFGPLGSYLHSLSPWISVMLAGACNLKHLRLAADLLPCLPQSGRHALESLHIDARNATAGLEAPTVVKDCQQLRSLMIVCHHGPAQPDDKPPEIPQLDLRHLQHLRTCRLDCVPAPGDIFLPRGLGELEVTITPQQIARWSKLWCTAYGIKDHVRCIKINGHRHFAHHARPADALATWPGEIRDFRDLQFLQVTCEGLGSLTSACPRGLRPSIMDLAHVAHIPYVSIQSTGDMFVEISEGSWESLELKSARVMHIDVQDPMGFVMCTKVFSFTFSADARPSYLIEKLEETVKELQRNIGTEIPRKLYEYHDSPSLLCDKKRVEPSLVEFTNRQREGILGENTYENAFSGARIRSATRQGCREAKYTGAAENLRHIRSATQQGYRGSNFNNIAENFRRMQIECAS